MSEHMPVYAEGYVAEVLNDGKVVVWPDETPDDIAQAMTWVPSLGERHYFAVDIVMQPPKELFGEEAEPAWVPTRWHRLITSDGELWMETSDEDEIKRELSGEAYRDMLEDLEEGEETPEPPPAGLIHQRLMQTPVSTMWRDVDE